MVPPVDARLPSASDPKAKKSNETAVKLSRRTHPKALLGALFFSEMASPQTLQNLSPSHW
jgi:hypothetical protein